MIIEKAQRFQIYQAIVAQGNFIGKYEKDQGIMSFLSRVWPLRGMESEDARYSNAYDDAFQHLVNNNDWSDEETYLKRFKLIDGEEHYFIKFIEAVVHPETRAGMDDIQKYVSIINAVLKESKYSLVNVEYYDELPIYKISETAKTKKLSDKVNQNLISFYKAGATIDNFPCFILSRHTWDDFTYKTLFDLNYKTGVKEDESIGRVKIMKRNAKVTVDEMEDEFTALSDEYCSLGQNKDYYLTLKARFPEGYQSILMALRDVAIFPRIYELFELDYAFKISLIRDNSVERLRRTIRAELLENPEENYAFNYIFRPPYNKEDDGFVNLFFNFVTKAEFPQRIVALIGKNGVGKTRILNSLIENLRTPGSNAIVPKNLLFSKYFTVSYSVFDRFLPPEPDISFNYVYCGLKKSPTSLKTHDEQMLEFYASVEEIERRSLLYDWFSILAAFLSNEHLEQIFPDHRKPSSVKYVQFSIENLKKIEDQFSSGESILLNVISKIVSEIRDNSLILYDEPETHLHPNAISDLLNALSNLLDRFNSFCILATHSPLVIRELNSSNVIVVKRNGNGMEAATISIDSFGQNLTVITEEIFSNKDASKLHLEKIRSLVQANKTFDEIIQILQAGPIPVNLNTRLYISSLIDDR